MVILIFVFFAPTWSWRWILTWGWCISAGAWLIVFAHVACVIVMRFIQTLPVIGLTLCIPWILVTLLKDVFTLRPVYQAWLEHLFVALSRNLVILFLVALVVSVTTIAITAILPLEVGALEPFRPSVATVVTPVTVAWQTFSSNLLQSSWCILRLTRCSIWRSCFLCKDPSATWEL